MKRHNPTGRGPGRSADYAIEIEQFLLELKEIHVEPEEVDGKQKEYVHLSQALNVYAKVFGKHAAAATTVQYRIKQTEASGLFPTDLQVIPNPGMKKDFTPRIFLNRQNKEMMEHLFVPHASGISESGYSKKSRSLEQDLAALKELNGEHNDEDDDW